jgi:hypothetical protein
MKCEKFEQRSKEIEKFNEFEMVQNSLERVQNEFKEVQNGSKEV